MTKSNHITIIRNKPTDETTLHSSRSSLGRTRLRLRLLLTPLVLIPIRQNMSNARRIRQPIDILEVLLCDLERPRGDIGDVLPDQLARVDGRLVDLAQQEGAEGLDAGSEECAVEWHVDALERDGGEAAL